MINLIGKTKIDLKDKKSKIRGLISYNLVIILLVFLTCKILYEKFYSKTKHLQDIEEGIEHMIDYEIDDEVEEEQDSIDSIIYYDEVGEEQDPIIDELLKNL